MIHETDTFLEISKGSHHLTHELCSNNVREPKQNWKISIKFEYFSTKRSVIPSRGMFYWYENGRGTVEFVQLLLLSPVKELYGLEGFYVSCLVWNLFNPHVQFP